MNEQDYKDEVERKKQKLGAIIFASIVVFIICVLWIGNFPNIISKVFRGSSWQVDDMMKDVSNKSNQVTDSYNKSKEFGTELMKRMDEADGLSASNYNSLSGALNVTTAATSTATTGQSLPKTE
jgi:hypothetical protein